MPSPCALLECVYKFSSLTMSWTLARGIAAMELVDEEVCSALYEMWGCF